MKTSCVRCLQTSCHSRQCGDERRNYDFDREDKLIAAVGQTASDGRDFRFDEDGCR